MKQLIFITTMLLSTVAYASQVAGPELGAPSFGEYYPMAGGSISVGPPPTACNALQADLSDTTGCNMTGFVLFLK